MPDFDDLGGFLTRELRLPVGGKTYTVTSPPAAVGLRLQASWAIHCARDAGVPAKPRDVALFADDAFDTTLEQDSLGPVYQQMLDDGVSLDVLNHAGMTAFLWHVAGDTAARMWWVSPKGEARRPLRPMSTSTNTGAASTTPTPRRGSGTRSPRKSAGASSRTRTPASPSSGPTSSTGGKRSSATSTPSTASTSTTPAPATGGGSAPESSA